MENKSSNLLVKTIVFILVVALSCLIFFGLGNENKTEMELYAFGFIMFAELVLYITILIPGIKNLKKLNSADIISWGLLYTITNFITNIGFFSKIPRIKTLLIINAIEIIIFLIIISIVLLKKKDQ